MYNFSDRKAPFLISCRAEHLGVRVILVLGGPGVAGLGQSLILSSIGGVVTCGKDKDKGLQLAFFTMPEKSE